MPDNKDKSPKIDWSHVDASSLCDELEITKLNQLFIENAKETGQPDLKFFAERTAEVTRPSPSLNNTSEIDFSTLNSECFTHIDDDLSAQFISKTLNNQSSENEIPTAATDLEEGIFPSRKEAVLYPPHEGVMLQITLDEFAGNNLKQAAIEQQITPSTLITRELFGPAFEVKGNVEETVPGTLLNLYWRMHEDLTSSDAGTSIAKIDQDTRDYTFNIELDSNLLNALELSDPESYIKTLIDRKYSDFYNASIDPSDFRM